MLEVGAGTGKFTRLIRPTGARIVAVEPVEAMRRKLVELVPGVVAVDGTAEALPAPDASADAVVAAQAFHWFRADRALTEFHRVLKRQGKLGLIWNVRDESVGWVHKLNDVIAPYEKSIPRYSSVDWQKAFADNGLFTPLQRVEFFHSHRLPVDGLFDRVASISFIAALPEPARKGVMDQVRQLIADDPALRGAERIDFPYRTDVYWCDKR